MAANPVEGGCWCASDSKCPHPITSKLNSLWDEIENSIDEVLAMFDRKSMQNFLKRDLDGNPIGNSVGKVKDAYKKAGKGGHRPTSPEGTRLKSNTHLGFTPEPMIGEIKSAMMIDPTGFAAMKRPKTAGDDPLLGNDSSSHVNRVKSLSKHGVGSRSMNALPPMSDRPSLENPSGGFAPADIMTAWGEHDGSLADSRLRPIEPDGPYATIGAGDTAIAAGIKRIGDALSRKILPWQAACCPRAVENLRDTRQLMIHNKHEEFLKKMATKLEEKVIGFLTKKEEEVDMWLRGELLSWRKSIGDEDNFVTTFIKEDFQRLTERAMAQEAAQKERDSHIAFLLDDQERDDTREQLATFRKLCRADAKQQADLKDLHSAIESAHTKVTATTANNKRMFIKRLEDAHDWLCCLADNALTASESERVLAQLSGSIDFERNRAFSSLDETIKTYTEQHNSILEAILLFSNRIRHHASDYLRREQLICRGFYHYLLDVIGCGVRAHASDHHKHTVAWEAKYMADRAAKRDQSILREYNLSLAPFEKLAHDLRERMKLQLERITNKMQSALTGQDNDISKRKGAIHRLLGRHVNKACSVRRQKLKSALSARRDEFEMEEKCVTAVNGLCKDLRVSIDQMWLKQHMRERRMYEAESGRMTRLEKSALIIWKQHSHLAIREKEDYESWLVDYRKEHAIMLSSRHEVVRQNWKDWRTQLSVELKRFASASRTAVNDMLGRALVIDASNTLDRSIFILGQYNTDKVEEYITNDIKRLRKLAADYMAAQIEDCEFNFQTQDNAFQANWNQRLFQLNKAVNRRVKKLKQMEAELEESISSTLVQHEIEAALFEQNSCARLEEFWVDQRTRMHNLSQQVKTAQVDFDIARFSGKRERKDLVKDRAVDIALEGNTPPVDEGQTGKASETRDPTDSERLKAVLDEVRPDSYREFNHKMTRGLEKMKRDYGEGKKRLIPLHHACKVLFSALDLFWDRARLSARCVGKVACRGTILFMNGMPAHGRALFCIGGASAILANLKVTYGRIDCQDIFNLLERGVKKIFVVGLFALTMQLGSFGKNLLLAETMWACSVCNVVPPPELVQAYTSTQTDKLNASRKSVKLDLDNSSTFFTDDPVDLVNAVLSVKEPKAKMEENEQAAAAAAAAGRSSSPVLDDIPMKSVSYDYANSPGAASLPNSPDSRLNSSGMIFTPAPTENLLDLTELIPVGEFLERVQLTLPIADIAMLLALLGRANGTVEVTPHRFCQAVLNWRRAAIAGILATVDPPGPEYSRINEVVSDHMVEKASKRRVGFSNVSCISPFEAVSHVIDWMTSIKHLPLSTVQALCLITRAGSCDPWLEDPFLHFRKGRFPDEVKEFVDLTFCRDMGGDAVQIQAFLAGNLAKTLHQLDVNNSGQVPLELIRSYMQRDDEDLLNSLVSAAFWSISRGFTSRESVVSAYGPAVGAILSPKTVIDSAYTEDQDSSVVSHKSVTEDIKTNFTGDALDYMVSFEKDVTRILTTIPYLDASVVSGMPPDAMNAEKAHEMVSAAIKLDPSARNGLPMSCCVWQGTKVVPVTEAIKAVTLPVDENEIDYDTISTTLNASSTDAVPVDPSSQKRFIGIGWPSPSIPEKLADVRVQVELGLLAKYSTLCDNKVSDAHYGAVGAPEITSERDQWKELADRRLARVDKLTIAWRNTMMNEWSNSLYQSRRRRYEDRAVAVKNCVETYLAQYDVLRNSIVEERSVLMNQLPPLYKEIKDANDDHKAYFTFHGKFLERIINRSDKYLADTFLVYQTLLKQYNRFCGTIKRFGQDKLKVAADRLEYELSNSCKSLITAYKGGYAKATFDDLVTRGNVWRTTASTMHGDIIAEKEKFVVAKENVHRELGVELTDCLTLDRNRTRSLLADLTEDSSVMQNSLAVTRAGYTTVQQDANARIVIRIERAMREARKLRTAAEEDHALEGAVFAEIRSVLGTTYTTCLSIVDQIRNASIQQLRTVDPLRLPHREKMLGRIDAASSGWSELEARLGSLLKNFKNEAFTLLGAMKVQCVEAVHVYDQTETNALNKEFRIERKALIAAFRKHFKEFDLSEAAIFDRFNAEVRATVAEMRVMFGTSRPEYITVAINDLESLHINALEETYKDISQRVDDHHTDRDDEEILRLAEVADAFCQPIGYCRDAAYILPDKYVVEKAKQLTEVANRSMYNNGDMIRPQVQAVIDLLISGIEIDTDFTKGYDSLISATAYKAKITLKEVTEFVDRLSDPTKPTSIDAAVAMLQNRIDQRREEVDTLIDAANTHVVADHSHMDVLTAAAEKDIEDWVILTKQLIENSFKDAESRFLTSLFQSPPHSPRFDELPAEEDRVSRIKALLKAHQEGTIPKPKKKRKVVENKEDMSVDPSVRVAGKPDEYIEMQDGWLECYTEDGFIYYYNPKTDESLWDLPASLKIPVADDVSVRLIDTPRSQIAGESAESNVMVLTPRPIEFNTRVKVDPEEVIHLVTAEAKAITSTAMEVALNITSILRAETRHRERPIPRVGDIDSESEIPMTIHARAPEYDPSHAGDASIALSEGSSYRHDRASESFVDDASSVISSVIIVSNKELMQLGIGSVPELDNESFAESNDYNERASLVGTVTSLSGMVSEANVDQLRAEEKFREVRENDAMFKDDAISKSMMDSLDADLKAKFSAAVYDIVQRDSIYQDQVDALKLMSKKLRRLTIIEALADNDTSWDRLDLRIFDTLAADEEARQLAARLRTDAGKKRQKLIIEHAEDIDELAAFLKDKAGLSKTTSRNAATEAVLKNISTAKKLAKTWARGQIDLAELGLDRDDVEEVESALQTLMQINNIDPMAQSMASMSNLLQGGQKVQSFSVKLQQQQMSAKQQALTIAPGFTLDAGMVTEVDSTSYESVTPQGQQGFFAPQAKSQKQMEQPAQAPGSTSAAAEGDPAWAGYKSFSGGWIECFSEDGHPYYYNTQSGESSWVLPEGSVEVPTAGGYDGYYDETGNYNYYPSNSEQQTNGSTRPSELSPRGPGLRSPRPTAIGKRGPLPMMPEISVYSKKVGVDRQLVLLGAQDRWQNCLVKCQFFITEQKALYIKGKEDMFAKVTQRVEARLATFVDDIKYMQRTMKKELGDLSASERDLRRMFEEDSVDVVHAEKLTFILEAVDKLQENTSTKYEAAHKQLAKFVDDWNLIETELLQVGDIFDESIVSNLEQCRMTCEHAAKVFVYDQLKSVNELKTQEINALRSKLSEVLREDTLETQSARISARAVQQQNLQMRAKVRSELEKEWGQGWDLEIEQELTARNLLPIDPSLEIRSEEEYVLGHLVSEIEMETVLADDYQSIVEATKKVSTDLAGSVKSFDDEEKKKVVDDGSWFNKHRDAIKRHASALNVTLQRVHGKIEDGYQQINARIEALDFDVEKAAEDELARVGGSVNASVDSLPDGKIVSPSRSMNMPLHLDD